MDPHVSCLVDPVTAGWPVFKCILCIFKIQNTVFVFKYIFAGSILYLYLNTFLQAVFCIFILNTFSCIYAHLWPLSTCVIFKCAIEINTGWLIGGEGVHKWESLQYRPDVTKALLLQKYRCFHHNNPPFWFCYNTGAQSFSLTRRFSSIVPLHQSKRKELLSWLLSLETFLVATKAENRAKEWL